MRWQLTSSTEEMASSNRTFYTAWRLRQSKGGKAQRLRRHTAVVVGQTRLLSHAVDKPSALNTSRVKRAKECHPGELGGRDGARQPSGKSLWKPIDNMPAGRQNKHMGHPTIAASVGREKGASNPPEHIHSTSPKDITPRLGTVVREASGRHPVPQGTPNSNPSGRTVR